jgi:hypothetical protein
VARSLPGGYHGRHFVHAGSYISAGPALVQTLHPCHKFPTSAIHAWRGKFALMIGIHGGLDCALGVYLRSERVTE